MLGKLTPRADHHRVLARVRKRFCAVIEAEPPLSGGLTRVREVVIIGSSSRGGSSVCAEMLRHCDDLLHLQAEMNPFLQLTGLSFPFVDTGSDALAARHADPTGPLARYLLWDMGRPCVQLAPADWDRFARHLWWRLGLQWPLVDLELGQVRRWVEQTRKELAGASGRVAPQLDDRDRFHALFLRRLHQAHPAVNPYYYDLAPELIRDCCPELPVPQGPPGPFLIEEPPFVTVGPWRAVTPEDLATRPLVIKTPSNAYRLPFLRQLFPEARLRLLHLTRHPAASINGLIDGWRHRGFFSHRVGDEQPLAIADYSETFPQWGRDWWSFDLPPGWRDQWEQSLPAVCAFQWRSAHETLLAETDPARRPGLESRRLCFEDAMESRAQRRRFFGSIADWLGVPMRGRFARVVEEGLRPVMATARPRMQRWFEKAQALEPVLRDARVRATMKRLGYDDQIFNGK